MTSLKLLRTRIKSIKSTNKITQAMKMISASRLKRAQDAVNHSSICNNEIENLLKSLLNELSNESYQNNLLTHNKIHPNTYLLVVFTSDKGLCGPYNHNIIKSVVSEIETLKKDNKKFKIFCVGKKGYHYLNKYYKENIMYEVNFLNNSPTSYDRSLIITEEILKAHQNHIFDQCLVFYTKYISTLSRKIVKDQVIPINSSKMKKKVCNSDDHANNFIVEPKLKSLLDKCILKYLSRKFHNMCLNSLVSEHSVRMTAMDNATRNSNQMTKKLTLLYNRTRQAQITNELIEIISGAEASV